MCVCVCILIKMYTYMYINKYLLLILLVIHTGRFCLMRSNEILNNSVSSGKAKLTFSRKKLHQISPEILHIIWTLILVYRPIEDIVIAKARTIYLLLLVDLVLLLVIGFRFLCAIIFWWQWIFLVCSLLKWKKQFYALAIQLLVSGQPQPLP